MAEKRDYYEVLGIQKGATEDEIKKAYRSMSKKYHPDLHPDDKDAEEKFKEVNEAYQVLSDQDKRARYDQFGHAGVDPNYGGGAGAGGGFGGFGGFGGEDDIFENIFGGFGGGFGGGGRSQASRANAPRRGGDVNQTLVIDFMEACMGAKKKVSVVHMVKCNECNGTGAGKDTTSTTCPDCNGRGSVQVTQQTILGPMASTKVCGKCRGKGKLIKNPCTKCKGSGRYRDTSEIEINIPAGIQADQILRVGGMGDAGVNGGGNGDMNLTFTVRPHELFTRDGYDIHCDIPISYAQAVLGDKIVVPTIHGKVEYEIPEGTQSGTKFRLRGKGVPVLHRKDQFGDQYVTVSVEVPKKLNKQQKDLLKAFDDALEEKNQVKKQSFFEKLKKKMSE